ncbi:MAG: chromosome segregation protein SMC [Bacillota bacterium]|nr:chromosome segregation protein SMC [Bacillota bacterium]
MYLKRMELYGFKSFADKSELEFSPGVTAIVGPNGSGKSNLADAIRWVLGEQSARILRGTRMEDVIFAGSGARKPLGFAEVTLVFDNVDGELPVDFVEVAVARRVYRSGESEFSICGTPCRLRDIQALFMDTGAGKEGYSVIEQGKIDAILGAGSDERRAFFEEAAGIHRYKARRAEAERRLAAADACAIRVRDVLGELSRQMEPLAAKADEARRFRECSEELAGLEVSLALGELDALEERRSALAQALSEIDRKLGDEGGVRESLVDEIARDRETLASIEDERDRLQERSAWLAAEVEKAEGRISLARERAEMQVAQAQALTEAVEKDRERLAGCTSESAAKNARLAEISSWLDAAALELDSLESEEAVLAERQRASEEAAGKVKADIIEVLSSVADARNELARMALEEATQARHLEREKREVDAALAELSEAESLAAREAARREQIAAGVRAASREMADLERSISAERQNLRALVAKRQALQAKAREESLEMNTLRRLASEGEWYPYGARAVLAGAGRGELAGVVGTVADCISVPQEYEVAIESALGQALSDIIVEGDVHARAAVRYLKERSLGRATFLPLDLVRPGELARAEEAALSLGGVVGRASALVSCEERVQRAVEHLLGRTVVVKDLDVAVRVARASGTRLKVVTLDGDLALPGGAISGGSRRARQRETPLALKRRLADLEESLSRLGEAEDSVAVAAAAAQDEVTNMERSLEDARARKQALELDAARAEAAHLQALRDIEKARSRVKVLQDEIDSSAKSDGSREELKRQLETRRARLEEAGRELARSQAKIAQDLEEIARKRQEVGRAVTDLRVKMAALTQEAAGLRGEIQALDARMRDLALEIEAREAELSHVAGTHLSANDDMASATAQVESLSRERAGVDEALASAREARRDLVRRVAQKESRLRLCQGELEDLQRAKASLTIEEAGLAEKAGRISDELERVYHLTLDEARGRAFGITDTDEARARARSLRLQIEALGPVDPGVVDVYEGLRARHGELSSGLDDVVKARAFLGGIMERSDRESERRFKETLGAIRTAFGRTFARLFGGGRADLVMTDEGSPASGIEIVAEPPGKRLQSLSLLSAGERALSAAALVFALLEVRPSPFCVLDEVDAALDEANVARFTELLRDAASRSQFIVVTHRKGTMEAADALYGVTMEESGISKLISIRIEDAGMRQQETA